MAHITPRVSFFATCNILEEQSNNSLPPLSIEMKPICTSQTIEGRKLVFCKCPLKACKKKASKEKRGKNDITVHIRSNTGERPFICKDCKKGYVCNSSLKTHSCTKRKKWKICWKHKKPFSSQSSSHPSPSNMSEISILRLQITDVLPHNNIRILI